MVAEKAGGDPKKLYAQCFLTRPLGTGYAFHTAWIPKSFARVGQVLRIDGLSPENGWTVSEVYDTAREDRLLARERDYKGQRQASDIERGVVRRQA